MRFLLAFFAALVAIAVYGCGPSCDTSAGINRGGAWKVCPNDGNPDPNLVGACKKAQAGPCSGKYNDWLGCVGGKITCDPTTKASDPASQVAALQACDPKYMAYEQCAGPTM